MPASTRASMARRKRDRHLAVMPDGFLSTRAFLVHRRALPNSPCLSSICDEFGSNLVSYKRKIIVGKKRATFQVLELSSQGRGDILSFTSNGSSIQVTKIHCQFDLPVGRAGEARQAINVRWLYDYRSPRWHRLVIRLPERLAINSIAADTKIAPFIQRS